MSKTDPWGELMAVARNHAIETTILGSIRNNRPSSYACDLCAGKWVGNDERHTHDCPIRPDRENPYAGLVEALADCLEALLVERKAFVHSHAVPPAFNEASLEGFAAEELAEMDRRIAKARAALARAEGRS